jgi:hypothetical protein
MAVMNIIDAYRLPVPLSWVKKMLLQVTPVIMCSNPLQHEVVSMVHDLVVVTQEVVEVD